MLTGLEARNVRGNVLELIFDETDLGFSVQEIEGLDPVDATLVSTSFADQDGEQYSSAKREKRNIVLKVGLEAEFTNFTVRQLRAQLYDYFMPKSQVFMRFLSDDLDDVDIDGYVESFNAPLFTNEPIATISVVCFESDFVNRNTRNIVLSTVNDGSESALTYEGTVETGFICTLDVTRDVNQISFSARQGNNVIRRMDFIANFLSGDIVTISTIPGQKGVYLTRAGLRISILYSLVASSDWLKLYPGDNMLAFTIPGSPMPYTLQYNDRYGGL